MSRIVAWVMAALAGVALTLTGCAAGQATPRSGVIVPGAAHFGVGSRAPNASFTDPGGAVWRLSSLHRDATVLAFTGNACSEPNPRLAAACASLRGGVTVIEVCAERCTSHDRAARDGASRLVSLCDPQGLLARRYHVSGPTALFVVGDYGRIVARGTLDDLDRLRGTAQRVADAAESLREDMYGGG